MKPLLTTPPITVTPLARLLLAALLGAACLTGLAPGLAEAASPSPPAALAQVPRYTFSWPLVPGAPTPRGGSTRGPAVTLDHEPSAAWRALQAPHLSAFERDRRAILAMAGDYRVTFDFLEIDTFRPDVARDRPYQSWGTERIYVNRDEGRLISLSHVLEMRIIGADGRISAPIVTRHWQQDWRYEPTQLVEYEGLNRWARRPVSPRERAGRWSQTVVQVDDSPQYASLGRWEHSASFSTWISGQTWRPLPRREWSVRKDYQLLLGTNRHTITPTGWLQEENNLKAVLTPDRTLDPSKPYLAREYGVARYERIRDADFQEADEYFQRTRDFWLRVQAAWDEQFRQHPVTTLRAPVDQAGLFAQLFDYADQLAAGKSPAQPAAQVIRESIQDDLVAQRH